MKLDSGIKGHQEMIVTPDKTAAIAGSDLPPVFGTPFMVALLEDTCRISVRSFLKEGQSTVGTRVEVEHLSATPVGMNVFCDSILTEVDRRRLVFSFEVRDECGLIGRGTHERFIIDRDKFTAKVNTKNK